MINVAVEREVVSAGLRLGDLLTTPRWQPFTCPAGRQIAPLRDPGGQLVGVLERQQHAISDVKEEGTSGAELILYVIGGVFLLLAGAGVLAALPDTKRYIRISTL